MNRSTAHLITLAALCLAPVAQAQQGVSLTTGLTDFTQWSLFGGASASNQTPGNGFTYSALTLTPPGVGGQAGAGFAPTALNIDFNQAFSFDFNFFIPVLSSMRGDGLTFTLAGAPGVGGTGSGLGYEGLGGRSVAFAIDTFNFDDEPISPSLQILQDGQMTPLAATETGLDDTIRDPDFQWFGRVTYTPSGAGDHTGLLTGAIEHIHLGSFSVQAQVDFSGLAGSPVFYGFTAANGAALDGHLITSAVPVPEPQTWALLLAGMLAVGWRVRRRMA